MTITRIHRITFLESPTYHHLIGESRGLSRSQECSEHNSGRLPSMWRAHLLYGINAALSTHTCNSYLLTSQKEFPGSLQFLYVVYISITEGTLMHNHGIFLGLNSNFIDEAKRQCKSENVIFYSG